MIRSRLKLAFIFSFSVLTLFTAGCSTPAYFAVPTQRFESPTVSGESFKGSIGVGYTRPNFIVTVKDVSASPPSSSGSEITKDPKGFESSTLDKMNLDLRLGLGKRFELSTVGDLYNLKYQFLGSSRYDAQPNEWVGSVLANVFTSSREDEITINGSTDNFDLEASGFGGSVIVGYRTDKNVIIYLNTNYLDFEADTNITQSSGAKFKYSDEGDQLSTSLGLRYEQSPKGFYAVMEWTYTKLGWADLKDKEWGSVGGLLGLSW